MEKPMKKLFLLLLLVSAHLLSSTTESTSIYPVSSSQRNCKRKSHVTLKVIPVTTADGNALDLQKTIQSIRAIQINELQWQDHSIKHDTNSSNHLSLQFSCIISGDSVEPLVQAIKSLSTYVEHVSIESVRHLPTEQEAYVLYAIVIGLCRLTGSC